MSNHNHYKPKQQPPYPPRVLTRPPLTQPDPTHPPPPPRPPPLPSGVVIIGFITPSLSLSSHLLNRVLDSHSFNPRAHPIITNNNNANDEDSETKIKEWFRRRDISYFHDVGNALVFLQFCSDKCISSNEEGNLDELIDEHCFGDLQGLLFMFTVCHIIVYIQEGSHFDTHLLKTLRVLQSAKHALVPFLRSNNLLPSPNRPASSSSSRPPATAISSKNPSPRRNNGLSNRNNSHVSVMSGLGSHTTLFPGQCTPVTLFAFIDDFSDMVSSSSVGEESIDSFSSNSSTGRSNLPIKGSAPLVVLSRPVSKGEGGLRKTLQSSLEAQIRFLIKKCRLLSSSESSSHVAPRSSVFSGSAPLLTLDASRAVVLLDSLTSRGGESLDFATGLVEEVLNGNVTSDSLLLESHCQSGNKEDIVALKEFLFKQADILKGKGGSVMNANSGSAAGVSMVAAAAAAAAASSASSARSTSVPELPSLETWLSSSQLILRGILSVKRGSGDENDNIRKKVRQRNGAQPVVESVSMKGFDLPESAVSLLESGESINRKFSALWCQRAQPAAKEVYLKDLPPCYPTSVHEAHLGKALNVFNSMVKGPAVQQFREKLEDECLSIWKSGRQLCDAISLTGRPCMHQRHEAEDYGSPTDNIGKEHNSGFVFLHACACGRSRQLRPDPFDFESANAKFNLFTDCDKLLPVLHLPKMSNNGIIQPSTWTIVRLGGSRYYEPSQGLLQAGFPSNQKFLLRWSLVLEKDKDSGVSFANALKQGSVGSATDAKVDSSGNEDANKTIGKPVKVGQTQTVAEVKPEKKMISFGRGLPNVTMRKAFAEVVAGSASSNSEFPPLQSNMKPSSGPGKSERKRATKLVTTEQINVSTRGVQRFEKPEDPSSQGGLNSTEMGDSGGAEGNPCLQIGSNLVSLNVDDGMSAHEKTVVSGVKTKFSPSFRHFVVYVGFEHECPNGHRFILSPELLNQLGPPYSLPEESHVAHSVEHNNRKHRGAFKMGQSDGHYRGQRTSNGNAFINNKADRSGRSSEVGFDADPTVNGRSVSSMPVNHVAVGPLLPPESVTETQQSQHSLNVDDSGPAFSLLNRNLPLYMNCPHCKTSKDKNDRENLRFAGTISQLQRIFLVTPPFPIVLVANPIVQFEKSCQSQVFSSHEEQLQFTLGCQTILPPESFVSIRLPFVYGTEVKDKGLQPLNPFEHKPELTAWIKQGTALQAIYKGSDPE